MEQTIIVSNKVPHSGYSLKIHEVYLVKESDIRTKLVAIAYLKKSNGENVTEGEVDIKDFVTVQLPPEQKDLPVEIVVTESDDQLIKEVTKYSASTRLYHHSVELPKQEDAKEIEQVGIFEKLLHLVSYGFPKAMEKAGYWDPRNLIAKNIFLSRLPEREEEKEIIEFVKSKGAPLGLVVSTVKHYEINKSLPLMDPVRPDEWKQLGIKHHRLPMQDFGSKVIIKTAANIVLEIQKCRDNNESVLVHCKAGRTRSAMLVACVLAVFDLGQDKEHKDKSPEQLIDLAVDQMLLNRKQVKLFNAIKATAAEIVIEARRMLQIQAGDISSLEELNQSFANQAIKNEIMKMDAYKELVSYKDKITKDVMFKAIPKRAQHIDKLLTSIAEAKDANWYSELIQLTGPSKDLVSAAPYFNVTDADRDKSVRESLVERLKNDVESLLCLNLGWDPAKFQSAFSPLDSKPAMSLRL